MAKGTAKPAAAAGGSRKKHSVRKYEDLVKTLHGRLFLFGKGAYNLGVKNKLAGTVYAGKKSDNWFEVTKASGPFFSLAETSDHFKKIRAAAQAAKGSLTSTPPKYDGSVQKFLDTFFEMSGGGGGGFNYAKLKDISL